MSRFPRGEHLAAWAGLAPGNNQSGETALREGFPPQATALAVAPSVG